MDVYRSHLNVAGSNLHAPFLPMRRFEIRQEDSRRTNAFIRIERISILERKHQLCFVRRADNTFRAPPRTALLRQSYKLFASTYSKGERSAWEEWRAIDAMERALNATNVQRTRYPLIRHDIVPFLQPIRACIIAWITLEWKSIVIIITVTSYVICLSDK